MQPSEEFEQNNFDRIQCALDIVHTIDELEYPLQSRSSTPKDTALLILEAACKLVRSNSGRFRFKTLDTILVA